MKCRGSFRSIAHILGALIGACVVAHAQDPRFALPDRSPLQLNPALTGALNDRQVVLTHRTLYNPVTKPFHSTYFSGDLCMDPPGPADREGKGRMAVGLAVMDDRAGEPRFRTTDLTTHLAYHLRMDTRSDLGAAIYIGLRQVKGDPGNGQWESQYDGMRYDPSIASGESFGLRPRTVPDMGAGVVYVLRSTESRAGTASWSMDAGAGLYHLSRPRISPDVTSDDRLPRRLTTYARMQIEDGKHRFILRPACFAGLQGGRAMVTVGGTVGRVLYEERGFMIVERKPAVHAGGYWSNLGGFTVVLGGQWGGYAMNLAYQLPLPGSYHMANGSAAAELVLAYALPAGTRR